MNEADRAILERIMRRSYQYHILEKHLLQVADGGHKSLYRLSCPIGLMLSREVAEALDETEPLAGGILADVVPAIHQGTEREVRARGWYARARFELLGTEQVRPVADRLAQALSELQKGHDREAVYGSLEGYAVYLEYLAAKWGVNLGLPVRVHALLEDEE